MACILFFGKRKCSRFDKKSKNFAWTQKTRKSALLQQELIQQGKFGIHFLVFRDKERVMKQLLPKIIFFHLGPKTSKKYYCTMGINSTGKIWHTFSCFRRKRAILTKNRNFSLGPKKAEKVLFYNKNSTRKIWHTFSCFWRKKN